MIDVVRRGYYRSLAGIGWERPSKKWFSSSKRLKKEWYDRFSSV